MSRYRVRIVEEAEEDLAAIVAHIAKHDAVERAEHVLDRLLSLCEGLEDKPMRGQVPPELDALGIKTYREVHFKPYRVIYEVTGRQVYIYVIVDGRRSLLSLLERRLLR